MKPLLVHYLYLQSLDLLTTIALLRNGVLEGNPVLQLLFRQTVSPLYLLVGAKLIALALGVYFWQMQKPRLIATVNACYAFLIAWNLIALAARPAEWNNALGITAP